MALALTVTETLRGHKLLALTAGAGGRKTHRAVVVGTANASLRAGQTQTVRIALNSTGKRLLVRRHRLKATLRVSQAASTGTAATVSRRVATFKATARSARHRAR